MVPFEDSNRERGVGRGTQEWMPKELIIIFYSLSAFGIAPGVFIAPNLVVEAYPAVYVCVGTQVPGPS